MNENLNIVQEKSLLKASQVSNILNISRAMAYRLMQQGKIPSVRISGSRRVRPEDLRRYIERNINPSTFQN